MTSICFNKAIFFNVLRPQPQITVLAFLTCMRAGDNPAAGAFSR